MKLIVAVFALMLLHISDAFHWLDRRLWLKSRILERRMAWFYRCSEYIAWRWTGFNDRPKELIWDKSSGMSENVNWKPFRWRRWP